MWLRFILIAFFANGLCSFVGRFVVGMDGRPNLTAFLLTLYVSGFVLMLLPLLRRGVGLKRGEVLLGVVLGVASFGATFGQILAMDYGMPGTIVYPVSMGGALLLVILSGRVLFKERMTYVGVFGVVVGIAAQILFATA
jgi:hypothetical protein